MQTKDQSVITLADHIVTLMRAHPHRYEAFDALDVARILFRPTLNPSTVGDQASAAQCQPAEHESSEAVQ